MLAADKLQLQSALKQQATALKEKEFNLHHSNLMTVGTQAAVLAGLDVTMFIEFQPPHNDEWGDAHHFARALKLVYYILIVSAFCANVTVVAQSTVLSVLGSSLALRGPDGSMMTATDGLHEERKSVFAAFGYGLALTVLSVVICVWILLSPESSVVCMCITIYTCYRMYSNYLRVTRMFGYDENDTVDFTDIFEGPAAIRTVSGSGGAGKRGGMGNWAQRRDRGDGRHNKGGGRIKSRTSDGRSGEGIGDRVGASDESSGERTMSTCGGETTGTDADEVGCLPLNGWGHHHHGGGKSNRTRRRRGRGSLAAATSSHSRGNFRCDVELGGVENKRLLKEITRDIQTV